ncbi:unnamed protein product [Gordionus sp. m RMFG-2023]|uniref:RNA-binding protein 26-like isoform X2 n=1 Tax=Gordionus sp. m RMFG-2023 TaxID=3053472 RepID=UPI0030E383B6
MLIENPAALQTWLVKILATLSEANPDALSKYVLALIKKDNKSEYELKKICVDQLDVFLQDETENFVNKLFEVIKTKGYNILTSKGTDKNSSSISLISKTSSSKTLGKSTSNLLKDNINTSSVSTHIDKNRRKRYESASSSSDSSSSEDNSNKLSSNIKVPSNNNNSYPNTNISKSVDKNNFNFNKEKVKSNNLKNYVSAIERNIANVTKISRDKERDKEKEREKIKEKDKEKVVKKYEFTTLSIDEKLIPPSSIAPSKQAHSSQQISPKDDRTITKNLEDNNYIDKSAPVYNERNASKDLPSSQLPQTPPKKTLIKSHDVGPENKINKTIIIPVSTSASSLVPTAAGSCRDYNEKGFCMKGDQCPYGHGKDAVVLTDVKSVFPFASESLPSHPPPMHPSSFLSSLPPPSFPSLPPPLFPPPHFPPPHSSRAPLLPPPQLPMTHHLSYPCTTNVMLSEYNPEEPGLARKAEIVGIDEEDVDLDHALEDVPDNFQVNIGGPIGGFDYGRLGGDFQDDTLTYTNNFNHHTNRKRLINSIKNKYNNVIINTRSNPSLFKNQNPQNQVGNKNNKTLELKKIPVEMNSISQLNGYFQRFGQLVNIQVNHDDDPRAALVTFSSNAEAYKAYKCQEPIFNNRFIKMFWHNPSKVESDNVNKFDRSESNELGFNDPLETELREDANPRIDSQKIARIKKFSSDTSHFNNHFKKIKLSQHNIPPPQHATDQMTGDWFDKNEEAHTPISITPATNDTMDPQSLRLDKRIDLTRTRYSLLLKRIENQRALIEKMSLKPALFSGSVRDTAIETMKELEQSVGKLKRELDDYYGSSNGINVNPATGAHGMSLIGNTIKENIIKMTKKQILDAELELITRAPKELLSNATNNLAFAPSPVNKETNSSFNTTEIQDIKLLIQRLNRKKAALLNSSNPIRLGKSRIINKLPSAYKKDVNTSSNGSLAVPRMRTGLSHAVDRRPKSLLLALHPSHPNQPINAEDEKWLVFGEKLKEYLGFKLLPAQTFERIESLEEGKGLNFRLEFENRKEAERFMSMASSSSLTFEGFNMRFTWQSSSTNNATTMPANSSIQILKNFPSNPQIDNASQIIPS